MNISYDHRRIDLIHFTAAIPLLAIRTYKNFNYLKNLAQKMTCTFLFGFIIDINYTLTRHKKKNQQLFHISINTLLMTLVPPNLLTNSSGVATVKSFSWSRLCIIPWDIDGLKKQTKKRGNFTTVISIIYTGLVKRKKKKKIILDLDLTYVKKIMAMYKWPEALVNIIFIGR